MKKLVLDLQRFGEGAGDGAGESGAAVTGETAESPAAGDTKRARSRRAGTENIPGIVVPYTRL